MSVIIFPGINVLPRSFHVTASNRENWIGELVAVAASNSVPATPAHVAPQMYCAPTLVTRQLSSLVPTCPAAGSALSRSEHSGHSVSIQMEGAAKGC